MTMSHPTIWCRMIPLVFSAHPPHALRSHARLLFLEIGTGSPFHYTPSHHLTSQCKKDSVSRLMGNAAWEHALTCRHTAHVMTSAHFPQQPSILRPLPDEEKKG